MKTTLNLLLLFVIMSIPVATFSQEETETETEMSDTLGVEEPVILPKSTDLFGVRLGLSLPNPIANKSFKKSFIGIYQMDLGLRMFLYKNLFMGVSFSTVAFKVDRDVIKDYKTFVNINDNTPILNANSAGITLGGQWYLGEKNRIKLSVDATAGQTFMKYSYFVCKDSAKEIGVQRNKAPYFTLTTEIYFLVQPNWGIGPSISYTNVQNSFDPYALCLDDWSNFPTNNSGATQYINWGLVFYYSFLSR